MDLTKELNETLYRKIHPLPRFWDEEFNRPSSSAFKDRNGLSVDRRGTRKEEVVLYSFSERFQNTVRCIVKLSVQTCLSVGVYPVDRATSKNEFHAEIHESPTCIEISPEKALLLAKHVTICEPIK